jgi:hypothetical protein
MSGQQHANLVRRCRSDTHEVAPNYLKKPLVFVEKRGRNLVIARYGCGKTIPLQFLFIIVTRTGVNQIARFSPGSSDCSGRAAKIGGYLKGPILTRFVTARPIDFWRKQ